MNRQLIRALRPFETLFPIMMESDSRLLQSMGSKMNVWVPRTNVSETDSSVKISSSLPGLKKEDIKLELKDDNRTLRIYGEHKEEVRGDKEEVHMYEMHFGSFERLIRLPKNIDADSIKAKVEDGVLRVEVPKVNKTTTPKSISIE
ncbi:HSP20 family protein [Acrasis kona]|uniref:HSP20 family protein n=1 Tax=Acrasis kona TaxID=1008807 RepID=A0AAW2ZT14_9EUKA